MNDEYKRWRQPICMDEELFNRERIIRLAKCLELVGNHDSKASAYLETRLKELAQKLKGGQ